MPNLSSKIRLFAVCKPSRLLTSIYKTMIIRVQNTSNFMENTLINIIGHKDLQTLKSTLTREEVAVVNKYRHAIKLANALDYGFWIGDNAHKTLYTNGIYQKNTGYPLNESIGQPSDFCFDEESKRAIAEHHKLRKIGLSSKYEATYLTKKGKKVPVLIVGAPTETGGTYGMHLDLTKLKKLEQDEKITEQIIKNSGEAIVILNPKKKIKLWNSGAEKLFGYKEVEVLNKELALIVIPTEEQKTNVSLVDEVDRKGFIRNVEVRRVTKKGSIIDVSLSITKVVDNKKKTVGYLVLYHDITQQKHVNFELQKRFETIQDAYKELGLQKRQLDYIYEIIDLATAKSSIQSVARVITSAACLLIKCDAAVLRLYDKKYDNLILTSSLGVSDKWLSKNKIPFSNSIAQDAFGIRRPLIIQDVDSYEKHKASKLVKEHGFKTLISLPLYVEDNYIGSLSLYATDPSKFRLIETDFLERFGKQCSLALFAKNKITKVAQD